MKTINSKMLLLCVVVLLTPVFLQSQNQIYFGQQFDHTYLNLEHIYVDDPAAYREGYVIASTTINNSSSPSGEIKRTDAGGGLHWVQQYMVTGGKDHRFNHISKTLVNGQVEYLVVGSIIDGGTTTLMVAIVDDNGIVQASQEFSSVNYSHLLGIKGVELSDQNFAIVAMEGDGFNSTDTKNIVVLKLDLGLGIIHSMAVSSPNNGGDYDFATDIIEGTNADEVFIIGSSNKNGSNASCALAASLDLPGNTVNWSYNYSTAGTGHWDGASSGYYDGSRLFILGNSSIIHYFNVVELDPSSGGFVAETQYEDPAYGLDYNHYGYEIRPSVTNSTGALVISGWKADYFANSVQPFLVEIDNGSWNINWQWKYNGLNNSQLSINENNWLYLRAASQFPYYYNDMMTYRVDREGYAMLSTDNTLNSREDAFFWYATDFVGRVNDNCGYEKLFGRIRSQNFTTNNAVSPIATTINAGIDNFLTENQIGYDNEPCGFGTFKNGVINSNKDLVENTFEVYPNPANNSLYINGENIAKITLTDIFGREILQEKASAKTHFSLNINNIKSGVYIVNITTTSGDVKTEKVQIIK